MERMYSVYRHTCPNGKVYIGLTSRKPRDRWDSGWGYCGQRFMEAIQKYGWNNIKHEVLFSGTNYDEAAELETCLIKAHHAADNRCGYNVESGGTHGKVLAESTKNKISQTLKAQGIKPPSQLGSISVKRKPVLQYDLNGCFIREHVSVKAASDYVGVTIMAISNAINGKVKYSAGYIWKTKGKAS